MPEELQPQRYRFTCEYDGRPFAGWQVQPGKVTVQGALQEAFSQVVQHPVTVVGSGRTDAGVHAEGQVAHVDVRTQVPEYNLWRGVNSNLPEGIAVLEIEPVDEDFHAQYSAKRKTYRYQIFESHIDRVFLSPFAWKIPPGGSQELDRERLSEALRYLEGEHDYESFRASGCSAKDAVRVIEKVRFAEDGPLIRVWFTGTGFVRHQIRIMVGTAVDIARNQRDPAEMQDIIGACHRDAAGRTAPPQGLCLESVEYP